MHYRTRWSSWRDGPQVALHHLAREVDALAELERISAALSAAGALVGASDHGTTKALFAQDPNGLEFEVSWLATDLIDAQVLNAKERIGQLDLAQEIARFGAQTRGGVGVSIPA